MSPAILADVVMAVHFLFVAFAVLGSFLVLRWFRLVWLHVPALAWAAWIEMSGNICPLTPLENRYRDLAGEAEYGEGFVTHYLGPVLYPAGLTRATQFVLLGVLIGINVIGYALVVRRRRAARGLPRR